MTVTIAAAARCPSRWSPCSTSGPRSWPLAHADAAVGAAIECAVEALKVPHIIVCGHDGCGGVRAALDDMAECALRVFDVSTEEFVPAAPIANS